MSLRLRLLARVATLVPAAQPFPSDAARGEAVVVVPRDALPDALGKLRDDPETASSSSPT
jgi:hypothetical protein